MSGPTELQLLALRQIKKELGNAFHILACEEVRIDQIGATGSPSNRLSEAIGNAQNWINAIEETL